MKIALTVRRLEERELCAESPSLLDEDEYEMYVNALYEELSCIEGVLDVLRSASIFHVDTTMNTLSAVKELLRPALTSSVMSKLRLASFVEL